MMKMTPNCIPLRSIDSANPDTVCIFGTGDFGRSLGLKMLQCGYSIVFGSRNPQSSDLIPKGAEVLSHKEAAQKSTIIILAVHREHYRFLTELSENLEGKILVDVSNNLKINQYPESNAEYLAKMVPGAKVIKAFNTLSAWALQSGALDASRQFADNSLLCLQSKLGYLTLMLCTAHTLVYGGDRFIYGPYYKWFLPPAFVISLIIPCTVLSMKLITIIPCLDSRITKIRQGWERNPKGQGELEKI
ncbi:metalloreductase STEAP4-like [Discoglossus pictus]